MIGSNVLREAPLLPFIQPYFHSGKVWSLKEAVVIMGSAQLGFKVSDSEADMIVAFLHALTGRQPKVDHPLLPPNGPDTPKPVTK